MENYGRNEIFVMWELRNGESHVQPPPTARYAVVLRNIRHNIMVRWSWVFHICLSVECGQKAMVISTDEKTRWVASGTPRTYGMFFAFSVGWLTIHLVNRIVVKCLCLDNPQLFFCDTNCTEKRASARFKSYLTTDILWARGWWEEKFRY